MKLNETICGDLGFNTIREWLADHAHSENNAQFFRTLAPTLSKGNVNESHQYSTEILAAFQRDDNLPICTLPATESWLQELAVPGAQLPPDPFKDILHILTQSRLLKKKLQDKHFSNWQKQSDSLLDLPKAEQKIASVFDDEFQVRPDASGTLKKIHQDLGNAQQRIQDRMQELFKEANRKGWLQEDRIVLRNGRSVLPIQVTHKRKIKGIIQNKSATGHTVFIEPLEIIELNNDLMELEFKKSEEIKRILRKLTKFFAPLQPELQLSLGLLEKFDQHYTMAALAFDQEAIPPTLSPGGKLELKQALNPLLMMNGKDVVPLNLKVTNEQRVLLLSGPNAGGKTVVLKTIGLYSIMAQCGLFIPAKKATLPFIKKLLCDIGDRQSIEDDLSTFSAHIQNLTHIIKNADSHTLILLDELGTGTDPDAGSAISQALLEDILSKHCLLLATTHLGALKSWAHETDGAVNGGMVFDSNALAPTYELQLGLPGASYAVEIATRMGMAESIIARARELIGDHSIKMEDILRTLEEKQQDAEALKADLETRESELVDKERAVKYLEQEVRKKHTSAKSSAAGEAEELVRQTRREMENLISEIRSTNADTDSIQQAKIHIDRKLKKLNRQSRTTIEKPKFKPISLKKAIAGAAVYIPHLQTEGTIIFPPNKQRKLTVEANGLKLTLKLDEVAEQKKTDNAHETKRISINTVQRPESMCLDLRGQRVDAALGELEQFLDRALVSGMNQVRILHGKGTGSLMEAVQTYLKEQSFIDSYEFASEEYGGAGITEVVLK